MSNFISSTDKWNLPIDIIKYIITFMSNPLVMKLVHKKLIYFVNEQYYSINYIHPLALGLPFTQELKVANIKKLQPIDIKSSINIKHFKALYKLKLVRSKNIYIGDLKLEELIVLDCVGISGIDKQKNLRKLTLSGCGLDFSMLELYEVSIFATTADFKNQRKIHKIVIIECCGVLLYNNDSLETLKVLNSCHISILNVIGVKRLILQRLSTIIGIELLHNLTYLKLYTNSKDIENADVLTTLPIAKLIIIDMDDGLNSKLDISFIKRIPTLVKLHYYRVGLDARAAIEKYYGSLKDKPKLLVKLYNNKITESVYVSISDLYSNLDHYVKWCEL